MKMNPLLRVGFSALKRQRDRSIFRHGIMGLKGAPPRATLAMAWPGGQ